MTEVRQYIPLFERILKQLEAGTDLRIPTWTPKPFDLDPVLEHHLDRVGILGGNLPSEIVTFYTYLHGIRTDLERLVAGEFDGNLTRKHNIIREDLGIWRDALARSQPLVDSLTAIANERLASRSRGEESVRTAPKELRRWTK